MKNQLIAFLNKAKDIKMPKMPAMSVGTKKPTSSLDQAISKEETKKTSETDESKSMMTPSKKKAPS